MTHAARAVTSTPTELVAAMTLANGDYTMQCIGNAPVWFAQKDAVQTEAQLRAAGGHYLVPYAPGVSITVNSDRLYVWTRAEGGASSVILSDA